MPGDPDRPTYRLRRPGGEVNTSRIFNAPGVVIAIGGACVVVFLFFVFAPERAVRLTEFAAAVNPARFMAGPERNGGLLAMGSPLIAHMFIHAGLMHLLFNMLWLLAFGTPVARRMGADGALQSSSAFAAASLFLTFYLLSGVAGALLFVGAHANEYQLLVGASGGVSGLLGALVRFGFSRSTLFAPEEGQLSPLLSRPVLLWSSFMLLINNPVSAALLSPMAGGASIAWEAHLGGYLFGLFTFPFFDRAARGYR